MPRPTQTPFQPLRAKAFPMRIFETIHLLLIFGFLFGVPVAAASRPSGAPFSWTQALSQGGSAALILAALFAINFAAARFFSRRASRR